ncbi:hypothetical protein [Pseudactinotalea terrae]|uniref:hypothetical protein n=1 Tax=Pseudactinotalea terrae TaxID=1743262 RepID=UPI0012E171F4|nr:hypothetical protein [Pseudactinotalea terrae]
MSVRRFRTAEQKRELVYEYVGLGYGRKGPFLREHGLGEATMRRWRAQVFAGSLELGLVPRRGGLVSAEESAGLARLLEQQAQLQQRLADLEADHERQLADKDAELASAQATIEALGKAIELLHRGGAGKSSPGTDAPSQV